jgi:hypothetical protein
MTGRRGSARVVSRHAHSDNEVQNALRYDQATACTPSPSLHEAAEGYVPPARLRRAGFGRLKNEWGMLSQRVHRIDRVRLHMDLTILAQSSLR